MSIVLLSRYNFDAPSSLALFTIASPRSQPIFFPCAFGETKDGLPYFGKPDPDKNEHYVLGFGGNGITFSVIAMNSILDSINNKKNKDLEYYKFKR